jgi:hypothetical protein
MMGLVIANGRLIHIADKESPSLVVRQYGEVGPSVFKDPSVEIRCLRHLIENAL